MNRLFTALKGASPPIVAAVVASLLLGAVLFLVVRNAPQEIPTVHVPISRVVQQAQVGNVARVLVPQAGDEITVEYKDGTTERSIKETGNFLEYLQRMEVPRENMPTVEVTLPPESPVGRIMGFVFLLLLGVPVVLLVAMAVARIGKKDGDASAGPTDQPSRSNNPANAANQFARSRARLLVADKPSTTFADVAGAAEAKEELEEIVDFLKRPDRYAAIGARIPKGLLMAGPPGTGKTLLARAVAGEAGVPFLSISGSEFVEMFVGVGAARVRDLFDQARHNAPCIVFIDEIDAVGRHRAAGMGMNNDEREQTLNQILVEMDGFDPRTNIIVVAATNRADVLDAALLRPGRFDRQIVLDIPDRKARLEILNVHARGKQISDGVDLAAIARLTPGFSGADLENTVNEAALLAVRRGGDTVAQQDLYEAIDRVTAGPRRKSPVMSPRERQVTAYHEVGHALVAHALANVDEVQKVTIVSRGSMGGYTRITPTEDKHLFTRSEFKDTLAWALGGQMAEQLIFGEMSTGASNDIGRATQLARRMVAEYGMSERLGPVAFFPSGSPRAMYGVQGPGDGHAYSNEVAYEIDQEVRDLLAEASRTASAVLTERKQALVVMAEALVEEETLEGGRLRELLDGKVPPKAVTDGAAAESPAA
ncbi:MAG: ATP-dependent zinc metalloprotease FtsH [Chloroflexota bacterium]